MVNNVNCKMDRVLIALGAIVSLNVMSILGTSFLNLNEKTKYKLILVQALLTVQSVMFFSARYLWIRLCCPLFNHPSFFNRVLLTIVILVLGLSQSSIVLGLIFSGEEPHWISLLSYSCLGVLILLTTTTVLSDLFSSASGLLQRSGSKPSSTQYVRLQIIVIVILSALFTALALHNGLKEPLLKTVRIPIKNLPAEFHGFTIVHLPDLHVGPTIGKTMLNKVVEASNKVNPDAITLAGDLVDATVFQIRQAVKPLLKLKARYGVYFVTGTILRTGLSNKCKRGINKRGKSWFGFFLCSNTFSQIYCVIISCIHHVTS